MPHRRRARQTLLTLAAIVILIAALREAAQIVVPILLALFLAFISSPLVFRLTRHKVPYEVSVGLVLFFELGVLAILGVLVGTSAAEFESRLPHYRHRLVELYAGTANWLREHGIPVETESLSDILNPGSVMDLIGGTVTRMGSVLTSALLVVFVLAFTLLDASRLWRKLEDRLGGGTAGDHPLGTVSHEVNRYLGVKSMTSASTGLLVGVWVGVVGVDFPILWGLLAFLLNYVPNIGSLLASIPPILIALLMLGWFQALLVAIGYFVVNTVIGTMLEPRILGRALGMSPVVVFLSMVVWGWVLGPVGALLSVPLTMILKIALANTRDWAWIADLMSGATRDEERELPVLDDEEEEQALEPPSGAGSPPDESE